MSYPLHDERREAPRGRTRRFWNLVFGLLRFISRHARNATAVFGIFLVSGAIIAALGTWGFAELAEHVKKGSTHAFDMRVMDWIALHQDPTTQAIMLEITALGTGTVVATIVLVAAMFLWLNRHKHSAVLLCVATLGGLVLNNLLKLGFDRPRPQVFAWGTHVVSSSFPSGHAMSAAIAYSTVAYLAARLQRNARSRVLTMLVAAIVVVLICVSRLYLGVHYPSDVIAGVTIGLAWAAFCMAVLEAAQLYARRNAPEMFEQEQPAPPRR